MFGTTSWMHASRVIRWYLMKEPDVAKRRSRLSEAVRISEGLYLPTMTVALETDSHKERRVASELLLDDEAISDLKAIIIEKIRRAANSGKLAGHSKMGGNRKSDEAGRRASGATYPSTTADDASGSRAGHGTGDRCIPG
jgi:hypothetical protein